MLDIINKLQLVGIQSVLDNLRLSLNEEFHEINF
jgi:hypothetical protein